MQEIEFHVNQLAQPSPGQFEVSQSFLSNFIASNTDKCDQFFTQLVQVDCSLNVKRWIVMEALPRLCELTKNPIFPEAFLQLLTVNPMLLNDPFLFTKMAQLFAVIYCQRLSQSFLAGLGKISPPAFFLRSLLESLNKIHALREE
jgi:hypothetical protein